MKKNRLFLVSLVLLLGILMSACGAEATPEPAPEPVVVEEVPVEVADTTPPQIVMKDLPYISFYNLGTCTPAPMVWKAEITDAEGAVSSAEVLVRFSSEDGFNISSDYRFLMSAVGNEYELALQNGELDLAVAQSILGTEKGLFLYRLIVVDQAGNSQYYPSESGWAELDLLPCYENADIEEAHGEVAAAAPAAATSTASAPNGSVTPTAPSSTSATCLVNPNDPSCAATFANPCDVNPSDPACGNIVIGGGNNGGTDGSIDPCVANPSDPSCQTVSIDPCVMNPSDPSCNPSPAPVPQDPCVADPTADGCVVTIDPPVIEPPTVIDPPTVVETPVVVFP